MHRKSILTVAHALVVAATALVYEPGLSQPAGTAESPNTGGAGTELATFGMGCFWGAEADFCVLDGVVNTSVGYAGGRTVAPTIDRSPAG